MSRMNIKKARRRRKVRVRIISRDNSSAILIAACLGFLAGKFGGKRIEL